MRNNLEFSGRTFTRYHATDVLAQAPFQNQSLCLSRYLMFMLTFLLKVLIISILGDPGADSGGEGKSKRAEKYGTKKSKERREEPLGTMSYQTSSKRSPFSGTNQKSERRRPFGTGLVRHCPQGLFSLFFTFLRAIFSRPFRLSLAPTICPWVSEDASLGSLRANLTQWSGHVLSPC